MKKTYLRPDQNVTELDVCHALLAGSGGVGDGGTLGNDYSESDESYAPGLDF